MAPRHSNSIRPIFPEMTRRFEALTKGGFPYLVAVMEDVVVGYAYAGPYRPRPAYRFTVENSVYLDPGAQGQRIGTRLMQDLDRGLRGAGLSPDDRGDR
jgi:phosphinothricin acetyltransferase